MQNGVFLKMADFGYFGSRDGLFADIMYIADRLCFICKYRYICTLYKKTGISPYFRLFLEL